MKNLIIGATLLFKKKDIEIISGILKSTVIVVNEKSAENEIQQKGLEIANFYNYEYIGVNDVFYVSGDVVEGEILGRTTYYDLNTLRKAKSIVSNDFSFDSDSNSQTFNCSLVYFCENSKGIKFTISAVTILNSSANSIIENANLTAKNPEIIRKIKTSSVENIVSALFVGIDDIGETDLKYKVFQSFYADFENIEDIKQEVISNKELKIKLGNVSKLVIH